ncbi:uncharacterized protein [Nicotiana tomentosiformis]|uniref:uncharacterized protein n=1 Tax=Nicotiana tomentosiformis TaxID=4098 RepID=UPI00388CBBDF
MIYSCLPGVTLVLSKLYIRQFSVAFGLQANLTKSFIYFGGVEKTEQMRILQIISYSLEELPFKYLGIPLDTKYLTILRWQPLVERIVARVSSWTARKLSYAGRVELVQTVLFGIQSYWAQLFIIPAKVMKLIKAYCRSYIWGYNLTNLQVWNKAAITKTYWDLAHKKDKASIRWIHAYYIKGKNILDIAIPQHASWMVRKILDARKNAQQIPSLNQQKNFIKQIYLGLMGNHNKVKWRRLLFHNDARPREIFSMWLQCHERLLIVDRLAKWESK